MATKNRERERSHGVLADEVIANHSSSVKNLKKVEEELQLDIKSLRATYENIRGGEREAERARKLRHPSRSKQLKSFIES